MKQSDWKQLGEIELIMNGHQEGRVDATEALYEIAKVIHPFKPENGYRLEKCAFLMGQIHGKIHNLMNSARLNSDIYMGLSELFEYMGSEIGELYYSKPQGAS